MLRPTASIALWGLLFGQVLAGITFLHDDAFLMCDIECAGDMQCGRNQVIKPKATPTCGPGRHHGCKLGLPIASTTPAPAPEKQETKGSLWERMFPRKADSHDALEMAENNSTTLGPKAFDDDLEQFMIAQVHWAKHNDNLVPHRSHGTGYSAVARIFHNRPFTVAIQHLFGCTSVVAISELGCFMSRHWESPSFQNASVFHDHVIDPLWNQDIAGKMPALQPLAEEGERFFESESPSVFIITPGSRSKGKDLEYPLLVSRLADNLKEMFSGKASITIVQYSTILDELDPAKLSRARGKVSLMYNPGDSFKPNPDRPGKWIQRAVTKLYVEGAEFAEHTWTAKLDQEIVPPQPPPPKKVNHHKHHLSTPYHHQPFAPPYRHRRAIVIPGV
jgi:hypothetical protein